MHLPFKSLFNSGWRRTALGTLAVYLCATAVSGETLPLDAKGSALSFTGEATLHTFRGEAKDFSGSADFDAGIVPPIQRATLHFKTATITTFHEERDQKMRAWLNIKIHPEATFQLESVKLLNGDYKTTNSAEPAKFAVAGTFILNGIKQPIEGIATGWREKDRVIVAGETTVDTAKHGLPQIRQALVMTVGTNVKITFRFSFVLPADYAAK